MHRGNLFENVPASLPQEHIETLLSGSGPVRVERIVSRGHASREGEWYDQDEVEWVVLLRGAAALEFEGQDQATEMRPGDWLEIPAHCRHRVTSTAAAEDTVWLAVFCGSPQ